MIQPEYPGFRLDHQALTQRRGQRAQAQSA